MLDNAAEGDIVGFVDKAGRQWSMERYTEMLTRTATMEMHNDAKRTEFLAHGEDLVILSDHGGSCEMCAPYNGKVLSLTGATEGYETLDEAEAQGLFHPNCRHTYSLYIEETAGAEQVETEETGWVEEKTEEIKIDKEGVYHLVPSFNSNSDTGKGQFSIEEPDKFIKELKAAKASLPAAVSWRVSSDVTPTDYKRALTYVAKGGGTVAITADGDIISLCKNDASSVHGRELLAQAIRNGGKKLDSYEGNYGFYTKNGFEPVSWCKWDDKFAPDDWKAAKVKPEDIVFFKYTGKQSNETRENFKKRVKASNDYDAAMEQRDRVM